MNPGPLANNNNNIIIIIIIIINPESIEIRQEKFKISVIFFNVQSVAYPCIKLGTLVQILDRQGFFILNNNIIIYR